MQLGDPGGELVGTVRHGGPEGSQDEDRRLRARLKDVLEHRDRRQLSPVQVVDHQGERTVLGQSPEHRRHGFEEIPSHLPGARYLLARHRRMPAHRRHEALQLALPSRHRRGQHSRRRRDEKVIEHLGERLVRDPPIGARCADQHGNIVLVQRPSRLGDQPSLAGTRLTSDEHDLAVAGQDLSPDGVQRLELEAAADERGLACCDEPARQGRELPLSLRGPTPRLGARGRQIAVIAPSGRIRPVTSTTTSAGRSARTVARRMASGDGAS